MLTTEQKIIYLKRAIERAESNYRHLESTHSGVRRSSVKFDLEMDWAALQRLRSELAELEGQDDA